MSKEKNTPSHYVDNKKFLKEMNSWKKIVIEAEESGEKRPPVTDYIGECFLKIAEHLSYRPNFINYQYREEMVGDGIENCLMYCHNFDPEKSSNPFSYFTQIIYYAFLRRIQKEKKQEYVKYRCFEIMDENGIIPEDFKLQMQEKFQTLNNPYANMFKLTETDIENFTPKKKKRKQKKNNTPLDSVFLEDDKSEDSPTE
jgi:hypothetical protein